MADVGPMLRDARLAKNVSLELACEDTNISLRYLQALENDEASVFPGEPYRVGFMRNYAEYLGLDGDTLIAQYRSAPAAALGDASPSSDDLAARGAADSSDAAALRQPLQRPSRSDRAKTLRHILFFGASVAIVACLVFFYTTWQSRTGRTMSETRSNTPSEYKVEGMPFEKRLYAGDSLIINVDNELYKLRLASIDDAVNLETPFGPMRLTLGEESPIDANNDGITEVVIAVSDFAKRNANAGALVRLEQRNNSAAASGDLSDAVVQVGPGGADASGTAQNAVSTPRSLFRSTRGPYPFVVLVTFRGPCMFRYEADRKEWVEKYYSKGESITINATNVLTIWASNAQGARVSVQASGGKTVDVDLGSPGEIAVKRLSWSQAEGAWALFAASAN